MVFEVAVAVADRDTVWSLWLVPINESQCMPSGLWTKALPSSVDNSLLKNSVWGANGP